MKTDYTREELIKICEKAIVPESKWSDRDSASSIRQVGDCWALLKAGCDFEVRTKENTEKDSNCITDEDTIWVDFFFNGFQRFEYGEDVDKEEKTNYLPTPKRLSEIKGKDWY